MDAVMLRIGPALREAREEVGMTQLDVTKAAQLSEHSLSRYETGHNIPRPDTLYRILEAVTLDYVDFFERATEARPDLVVPKYREAAPTVQAAIMAAMERLMKRDGYTRRGFTRLHGAPKAPQWAQYEAGGVPSLTTLFNFCACLGADWLSFWADVQGRLDGGRR